MIEDAFFLSCVGEAEWRGGIAWEEEEMMVVELLKVVEGEVERECVEHS